VLATESKYLVLALHLKFANPKKIDHRISNILASYMLYLDYYFSDVPVSATMDISKYQNSVTFMMEPLIAPVSIYYAKRMMWNVLRQINLLDS
jgi:hypothetical protein